SAAQLERLSELVDVPVDVLRNKLEQKGKSFIWIKRQLDPKVAEEVKALGLENFVFEKELKRHYPMGNLFAHVIGFTDIDGKGQEGLELSLEDSLHGEDGAEVVLRDRQ
ncbi:penicillin-binding protein 2, partial [Pseudomonas aeruginosa]